MIKLILLFCLLSIASYAQKSIYPLPYQFDDTYFITLVGQNNPMKPSSFEVVLSSTDEDKLILTQNYLLPLNCPQIDSVEHLLNYEKYASKECTGIFTKYNTNLIQKIHNQDYDIYIFENDIQTDQHAFIIEKTNIIAMLMYIGHNNQYKDFHKLLYTVQKNTTVHKIDFFLEKAKQHLDNGNLVSANKNLVSALMLEQNNLKLKKLYLKYFEYQKRHNDLNKLMVMSIIQKQNDKK